MKKTVNDKKILGAYTGSFNNVKGAIAHIINKAGSKMMRSV